MNFLSASVHWKISRTSQRRKEQSLLTVKNGESVIPKVFEMAQALSVGISSVSLRKPNLEDVFIKLTGREIRDEPVPEPKERIRIFMRTRMR